MGEAILLGHSETTEVVHVFCQCHVHGLLSFFKPALPLLFFFRFPFFYDLCYSTHLKSLDRIATQRFQLAVCFPSLMLSIERILCAWIRPTSSSREYCYEISAILLQGLIRDDETAFAHSRAVTTVQRLVSGAGEAAFKSACNDRR